MFSTESGIPEEVGSPPSAIMWSPRAANTPGGSPTSGFGAPPSQLLPSSLQSQVRADLALRQLTEHFGETYISRETAARMQRVALNKGA